MSYLSIRDLDLNGKKVFIRVDFNVPLVKNEKGEMEISSDKRIKSSLAHHSIRARSRSRRHPGFAPGPPQGQTESGNEPPPGGGALG